MNDSKIAKLPAAMILQAAAQIWPEVSFRTTLHFADHLAGQQAEGKQPFEPGVITFTVQIGAHVTPFGVLWMGYSPEADGLYIRRGNLVDDAEAARSREAVAILRELVKAQQQDNPVEFGRQLARAEMLLDQLRSQALNSLDFRGPRGA